MTLAFLMSQVSLRATPPFWSEGWRADNRSRLDVYEVPILGKYYFRHEKKLQPFVATGYSFRKVQEATDYAVTTPTPDRGVTQAKA